ncbi:unnamed protein product, partial [Adineta steineri]
IEDMSRLHYPHNGGHRSPRKILSSDMSAQTFNFKLSGVPGLNEHTGAASVEAMDIGDSSNPLLSSATSRFTVKPTTTNKPNTNKPMSP